MVRASDIRRILVALDASSNSDEALEAAARLAALLKAEIEGVFVEDIDLLNLAGLEWTRQINRSTGRPEPLDIAAMESAIRAQAMALHRALEAVATRNRVRWSFRTLRGQVAQELLAAADTADLMIVGALKRAFGTTGQIGSTASAAAERASRSVLLLRGSIDLSRPMFVAYGNSERDDHTLQVAADLAELGDTRLTVLILADDRPGADALERKARDLLEGRRIATTYRQISEATVTALCRVASATDGGVMVIGADSPLIVGEERRHLLESVRCPVLLVR